MKVFPHDVIINFQTLFKSVKRGFNKILVAFNAKLLFEKKTFATSLKTLNTTK